MTKKTLTEAKAIELAQKYNLDVPQIYTKHYIDRGYFKSGDTLVSFIKTLEQIADKVELKKAPKSSKVLTGAKRRYILTNIKEQATERDDKRATSLTKTEHSFKNAVLKILNGKHQQGDKTVYTAKHWGKKVFNTAFYTSESRLSNSLYQALGYQADEAYNQLFNSPKIIADVQKNYDNATKTLVEKVFKSLEADGEIKISYSYLAVTLDDNKNEMFINIDENIHTNASTLRSSMIKNKFGSNANYAKLYKSELEDDKEIANRFKQELVETIGFYYSFKNIEIELVNPKQIAPAQLGKAKKDAHTASLKNFLEKVEVNRGIENILKKWDGQGSNPLGFLTNVFALELSNLVIDPNHRIILDDKLIQLYVQTYNRNTNKRLKLNRITA